MNLYAVWADVCRCAGVPGQTYDQVDVPVQVDACPRWRYIVLTDGQPLPPPGHRPHTVDIVRVEHDVNMGCLREDTRNPERDSPHQLPEQRALQPFDLGLVPVKIIELDYLHRSILRS